MRPRSGKRECMRESVYEKEKDRERRGYAFVNINVNIRHCTHARIMVVFYLECRVLEHKVRNKQLVTNSREQKTIY